MKRIQVFVDWIMTFKGTQRMIVMLLLLLIVAYGLIIPALWGTNKGMDLRIDSVHERCDSNLKRANDKINDLSVENSIQWMKAEEETRGLMDSLYRSDMRTKTLIKQLKRKRR